MFLIIKYIAAHLTQNLFKNHPTLFFTPPPPPNLTQKLSISHRELDVVPHQQRGDLLNAKGAKWKVYSELWVLPRWAGCIEGG